jgi:hypothetical protein
VGLAGAGGDARILILALTLWASDTLRGLSPGWGGAGAGPDLELFSMLRVLLGVVSPELQTGERSPGFRDEAALAAGH